MCDIFGKDILGENNKIDRKKLGNIVFSGKEKMDILTDVTWEYMQEKIDKILDKQPEIVVLDWALLPISKYWEMCNTKILVISEQKERKKRVIERDEITEDYFKKRDAKSLDYKNLNFDFIWNNDYQKESMYELVKNISEKIRRC